jgi:hypothetical protein
MTKEELRKHFNLKPGVNPIHKFSFGNLIGEWAEDYWSQLVDDKMQTFWFSIHTIESIEGIKAGSFVFWKFKIIFGLVK